MIRGSYRHLDRDGKCICCGRDIKKFTEKVFRFQSHLSNQYGVSLCTDCVNVIYTEKKYSDIEEAQ